MSAFKLLLADPGWKFGDSLPGKTRGASKNYATMNIEDVIKFPLPPLADDAVLLLWRVASMQEEALAVARAWGFTVKSEIVWVKTRGVGVLHFGMGRYVRNCHEVCLVATRGRGNLNVKNRSTRSIFFQELGERHVTFSAPLGEHSEKPSEFFHLVENLFEGPYCELFARKNRAGWTGYGLELPGRPAAPPL